MNPNDGRSNTTELLLAGFGDGSDDVLLEFVPSFRTKSNDDLWVFSRDINIDPRPKLIQMRCGLQSFERRISKCSDKMNCHVVANSLIRLYAGNRVASVNKCKKSLAIVVEAGLQSYIQNRNLVFVGPPIEFPSNLIKELFGLLRYDRGDLRKSGPTLPQFQKLLHLFPP